MTDTEPGRVRIETHDPDGRKRIGVRVYVGDEDISKRVTAVDFHGEGQSAPTATIHVVGAEISAEAEHVTVVRHDATPDGGERPDELGLLRLQVADLQASRLICVGCRIEQHLGQRDTPNPAVAVVNGMSSCLEHWQIVDGPVLPDRSPGGILLPGQINGG